MHRSVRHLPSSSSGSTGRFNPTHVNTIDRIAQPIHPVWYARSAYEAARATESVSDAQTLLA